MAEDSAKNLLPYLQRADELQKHDPLTAYYCRLYAMDRGLKIPSKERSKETNELLGSIINQLEKDKQTVKRGPDDQYHVEGFAQRVFEKADKQDRAGKADITTAKSFYAAGIFFEVASQFGDLNPELEQKKKYAVWKAGDIRKALKEGRVPTPGPPGGDATMEGGDFAQQQQQQQQQFLSPSSFDTAFSQSQQGAGFPSTTAPPSSSAVDSFGFPVAPSLTPNPSFKAATSSTGFPVARPVGNGPGGPPSANGLPGTSPSGAPPPGGSTGFAGGMYGQSGDPGLPGGSYGAPPQGYGSGMPSAYPPHTGAPGAHSNPLLAHASAPPFPPPPSIPAAPAATHQPPPPAPAPAPASVPGPFGGNGAGNVASLAAQTSSMSVAPGSGAGAGGGGGFSSYGQVPPGKVAEAHKAARFAVSALAFDDVPTAVEYLKKSLELLTKS